MRPRLIAFGLGAYSGLLAGSYEAQHLGFLFPLYFTHQALFLVIAVSLIAPIVEEQVKPLGLYLLKVSRTRLTLKKWVSAGTCAGLGFGLLENLIYFVAALLHGIGVGLMLLALRTMLSLPLHMIATSCSGFGVGLWSRSGRLGDLVRFLLLAMVIHSSFNLAAVLAAGIA